MNTFVDSYHFEGNKLSIEWCRKVAEAVCYHGGCTNLLAGKNVSEIEQYSTGEINMKPWIKMLRSYKRKYEKALKSQMGDYVGGNEQLEEIYNSFIPTPLIPVKLNSAAHLIYKVLFNFTVQATDSFAEEKREEDINFLKNRQIMQNVAQDLADQLQQGNVDVGGTKNSSTEFKKIPLDLDLNDPIERKIFTDIIYKLQPEAAYETILQLIYEAKRINGVDLLEIYDDFKFGVRANRVKNSTITGIPDVEYLYPGHCFMPKSLYPDCRDVSKCYIKHYPTVMEFFNQFGNEIGSQEDLKKIINGSKAEGGWAGCNGVETIPSQNWDRTQLEIYEVQVISVDKIHYMENGSGQKRFVETEKKGCKTLYGQNTYRFFWLPKTNHFFGCEKLPWAFRKQGQEAFMRFDCNFYRSQKKSAVEHCIGENKKAILADIKLQHAILKARSGSGMYVDMKYVRNAVKGLMFDGRTREEVTKEILDFIMEEGIMLGDSEGMNGQNEGQFQPVKEIPGGLKNDINGFLTIMQVASANISRWTGINDELSGLNNNPDLLNGARRLNITYGMNAINYSYEARQTQYRSVFEIIAWYVKDAVDRGGMDKKTIEQLIGKDRTKALGNIGSLKDHQFYIKVMLGMKPEELNDLVQTMNLMQAKGQLNHISRYIVMQTDNLKEANLLIAGIEHKADKRAEAQAQQNFAQAQQLQQEKVQGNIAGIQATAAGKKDLALTNAELSANLMKLGNELTLTNQQIETLQKRALQNDRLTAGLLKEDHRSQAKSDQFENQQVSALV